MHLMIRNMQKAIELHLSNYILITYYRARGSSANQDQDKQEANSRYNLISPENRAGEISMLHNIFLNLVYYCKSTRNRRRKKLWQSSFL